MFRRLVTHDGIWNIMISASTLAGVTTGSDHRQGIAKRDKSQTALRLYTVAPLRENKCRRVLGETNHIFPSFSSKSLLSEIEERLAEIYDIDGIELGNGEMVIHRLDIPSCTKKRRAQVKATEL